MKTFMNFACLLLFTAFATAGESADKVEKAKSAEQEKMQESEKKQEEKAEEKKMADIPFMKTKLGVEYYDIKEGTGKVCKMGSRFECDYTLWFADENGEKKTRFQSSKDSGKRFQWTLGQGLIQGWSNGMEGMKEGGTRLLRISPELGYGEGGRGIPPNTTLIFEIKLYRLIKQ